jgi:2Fe-2S ferredoxin
VGPPELLEEEMLDMAPDVGPTSRLSCQIKLTLEMDGLVVAIPNTQR